MLFFQFSGSEKVVFQQLKANGVGALLQTSADVHAQQTEALQRRSANSMCTLTELKTELMKSDVYLNRMCVLFAVFHFNIPKASSIPSEQ